MSETPNEIMNVLTPDTLGMRAAMDADAMNFLFELGCKTRDYTIQTINGATYVNTARENPLTRVDPYEKPEPEPLNSIYTLTGLVEYLKNDVDGHYLRHSTLQAVVSNFDRVDIYTPVHGEMRQRSLLASCRFARPDITLNRYLDQECFSVMLQTHFDEGENREKVLKIAGNIRMEGEATLADDGVTQCVSMKNGISMVSDVQIANPIPLAPHRTFPEIEQPGSPFVLRVRKGEGGAEIALFEADSGAWKVNAVYAIGHWLKEQLHDTPVVVIA